MRKGIKTCIPHFVALKTIYPEHHWEDHKFKRPSNYWNDPSNQRQFMDDLIKKLNLTSLKFLTTSSLQKNGGASLLQKYHGSVTKLLVTVYPEYKKMCREFVIEIVQDAKISKVEDVVSLPQEYHHTEQMIGKHICSNIKGKY